MGKALRKNRQLPALAVHQGLGILGNTHFLWISQQGLARLRSVTAVTAGALLLCTAGVHVQQNWHTERTAWRDGVTHVSCLYELSAKQREAALCTATKKPKQEHP